MEIYYRKHTTKQSAHGRLTTDYRHSQHEQKQTRYAIVTWHRVVPWCSLSAIKQHLRQRPEQTVDVKTYQIAVHRPYHMTRHTATKEHTPVFCQTRASVSSQLSLQNHDASRVRVLIPCTRRSACTQVWHTQPRGKRSHSHSYREHIPVHRRNRLVERLVND